MDEMRDVNEKALELAKKMHLVRKLEYGWKQVKTAYPEMLGEEKDPDFLSIVEKEGYKNFYMYETPLAEFGMMQGEEGYVKSYTKQISIRFDGYGDIYALYYGTHGEYAYKMLYSPFGPIRKGKRIFFYPSVFVTTPVMWSNKQTAEYFSLPLSWVRGGRDIEKGGDEI